MEDHATLGIKPGYPTHKTHAPVIGVPCQYEIQDFSKIIWKKQISSRLDGIASKGGITDTMEDKVLGPILNFQAEEKCLFDVSLIIL